jgi:hypothetical protein
MTNRIIALAALAVLPACATLQPDALLPRSELLSDAPPRPLDTRCRVSAEPRALPSVDALVDSAALAAAVADAWRASGRPAGHVLLGLRYDRAGINVRRDVIEHRVGDALADSLQKLVFAHRRTTDAAEREWSVRLRVDAGEAPSLRVGRTEVCSARPRTAPESGPNGRTAGAPWGDVRSAMAGPSFADAYNPSTVWVRVALDARGYVTDARVERSVARVAWENRLLSYVRTLSFVPAMEDGYPVPAHLSLPLSLEQ